MSEKHGPWLIEASEEKYKNPWIKVREDKVVRPDGNPGIFGVITTLGGVSVLPIDEKNHVYLTEEFRYAIGEDSIEAASGGSDKGEIPIDTAKRELEEELGIGAEEWIDLGIVNPLTSVLFASQKIYLARKLKFKEANREGTEVIKLVKIKFEEAVNMVMKSEITHAPTCVLILKASEYLRKI
jgi:8-oxo-dGTP pyrophosphatase MutT (NUDIX family)